MTKLDLHLHTKGSDGTGKPEEFVQAIRKAGLDGIVITDHHKTLTYEGLEVVKAVRAAGLVALVGCEYSTREGHCLVFGVDVARLKFGYWPPMQEVLDKVAEVGGVAFPSHPFRGVKETLGNKIYKLNGLTHTEAYNGQNEAGNGWAASANPVANQKAVKAAEVMELGATGGSDAHQPDRIGTCYTEFGGKVRTVAELVAALKAKDHIPRVNQEMVKEQRSKAKTWKNEWLQNTREMPVWMADEDREIASRLDRDTERFYSGQDEEDADSGQLELGYGDAERSYYGSEFAEVQAFLARENRARRSKRRRGH